MTSNVVATISFKDGRRREIFVDTCYKNNKEIHSVIDADAIIFRMLDGTVYKYDELVVTFKDGVMIPDPDYIFTRQSGNVWVNADEVHSIFMTEKHPGYSHGRRIGR